ncbi:hypothetical protein F2P81_005288 [Scophthalmus maximus]|uniref:Uncharacterized protein n=1 Tax=Scophthalmus maximus TaxID=52904 RepID=A0A6A4T2Q3_SCOMX|nr:hypothetical protein F2P81_005288 [Scophthalmus maximus]
MRQGNMGDSECNFVCSSKPRGQLIIVRPEIHDRKVCGRRENESINYRYATFRLRSVSMWELVLLFVGLNSVGVRSQSQQLGFETLPPALDRSGENVTRDSEA